MIFPKFLLPGSWVFCLNPERILLFAMKKKPRQTAHNLGAEGAPSEKVTRELTRTEWRVGMARFFYKRRLSPVTIRRFSSKGS